MILGDGTTATAIRENVGEVDFCWIADDIGYGESEAFITTARSFLQDLEFESQVVISSQVRVGTCAQLEAEFPGLWFAVVPENLRAATATEDFKVQDRIVFGARRFSQFGPAIEVLSRFTENLLFMSPESAEMSKHALNGWLALSITYANEIARIAETHDADPVEVAAALMSDSRIGSQAYLKPGPGLSPHLEREVANLCDLGAGPLIKAMR